MTTRRPDYLIKALDKTTEQRGKIGAAWKNEDGSISLVLDPFVSIHGRDRFLLITLFENTPKKGASE